MGFGALYIKAKTMCTGCRKWLWLMVHCDHAYEGSETSYCPHCKKDTDKIITDFKND